MITLEEIALMCGVSPSSVSRALNDHYDISDEKKELIRETAERMGYRNKKIERSRVHTFMIGLVVTKDAELIKNDLLILEIRKCLIEKGYDLVLLSSAEKAGKSAVKKSEKGVNKSVSESTMKSPENSENKKEKKKAISRPGVLYRARFLELEGIFLISNVKESDLYHMQELKELRSLALGEIPVVTVGSTLSSWGSVMPDHEEGLAQIFRRICRSGHRRIALVYGRKGGRVYSLEKKLIDIAREIGMDLSVNNIFCVEPEDEQGALLATEAILKRAKWFKPTCLVFSDDLLLQGGMSAVSRMGLSVPDDLSVVSMRYLDFKGHSDKALTCWDMNLHGIAAEAVDMMLQEIGLPGSSTRQTRYVKGSMKEGDTLKVMKTVFF